MREWECGKVGWSKTLPRRVPQALGSCDVAVDVQISGMIVKIISNIVRVMRERGR